MPWVIAAEGLGKYIVRTSKGGSSVKGEVFEINVVEMPWEPIIHASRDGNMMFWADEKKKVGAWESHAMIPASSRTI